MSGSRKPGTLQRLLLGGAPRAAGALAYLALAPLVVLVLIVAIAGVGALTQDDAARALISYGALLLAFHAGSLLGRGTTKGARQAVVLVLVPLLGWAMLFVPVTPAIVVLAALFAAQGATDVWASSGIRAPAWYGRLRAATTIVAVAALVIAFLVLQAR